MTEFASTPYIRFDPGQVNGAAPSPCISICLMDTHTGLCQGCQRNLNEIAGWSSATESEKRVVWHAINRRRNGLTDA